MEVLPYYIHKLEERLCVPPRWPPASISRYMAKLLCMERTGIYDVGQEVQIAINRYMFEKASAYIPDLYQVIMNYKDSHLFDEARLFPIHNFEWLIAAFEFFTEHYNELSWVSESAFAKLHRMAKKNYGKDISDALKDITDQAILDKTKDWNRILYETIEDILTFIREYSSKDIENAESFLNELICSMSDHTWASKDRIDLVEHYERTLKYGAKVQPGLIMFSIMSSINVKMKSKKTNVINK